MTVNVCRRVSTSGRRRRAGAEQLVRGRRDSTATGSRRHLARVKNRPRRT